MRGLSAPLLALIVTACAAPTPSPAPALVPPLAGSEWGPVDARDAFVRFGADGALAASAGCNALRASFAQNGSQLTLGPVAATRKLCPPDVMAREAALIAALEGTASARGRDDGKLGLLVLQDGDGKELLVLQRRDWD